jgi:hypothetical protein
VDACFRLKRRIISTEQLDPGLATGLAYFVPQDEYQPFQKRTGDQKEVCNVSNPLKYLLTVLSYLRKVLVMVVTWRRFSRPTPNTTKAMPLLV